MEQKLKDVLLRLGYRLYHWEGYDKETGTYHVEVLHSIKTGASRLTQTTRIENKLMSELTKAGLKGVKIYVKEDRYKAGCGTYLKIEDDSEKRIDVETRKGYLSELSAYIELETQLA